MSIANPVNTQGFDFLEFTTNDLKKLTDQFVSMGFTPIAKHKNCEVTIFKQNDIMFFVNTTQDSMAKNFANAHGASTSAMGFRVSDAEFAFKHAIAKGAKPYYAENEKKIYNLPAIYGVGNSLIYFVDYKNNNKPNYQDNFSYRDLSHIPNKNDCGLTYIDHVTHNLYRGNMIKWADFYTNIFNFREIRYFDIEGKLTGLKSKAMTSPCGKIRIPLNESADDQSQIEEFLHLFKGEGIQHIALGTNNIYESVSMLRKNKLNFLDTPDTYYEMIENRLPNHGEMLSDLKKLKILIDGNSKEEKKLLLQIFTENLLGPVFFEIIQRKGDEGFGEGNFRALFESIELDQIKRGVIKTEEQTI